jgi:NAD(P)-dependent dehydrogenase (short-subunit alcohol dehydrogenase family)
MGGLDVPRSPPMSMQSRVVVTGASGNLGAVVVQRLLRAGARVAALTRKDADLSDEQQVERAYDLAVQRLGPLFGAVHCAGGWAAGRVAESSVEVFEKMIDINLRSTFLCCRAALRRMPKEGRIVNVAALTAAQLVHVGGSAAYAAAKAGVIALTRAIAEEGVGKGIRCSCVAPGAMRTPQNGDAPGQVPLEDVAEGILYLLSPEAGAASGSVLTFPSAD